MEELLCASITSDKRDPKLFFASSENFWSWASKDVKKKTSGEEDTLLPEPKLHPVILIPGDGGSRIQAKLDDPSKDPFLCTKKTTDFYDLWVNIEQLSFGVECWKQNMALTYDPNTRTTSDIQGVTTRIPGAPPAGTTVDVEWLDSDKLSFTAYYALTVQKLVAIGYETGVNLHGAPYDFRRAANEQEKYFTELRNLIEYTYDTVSYLAWITNQIKLCLNFQNGNTPVVMIAHSMGCSMSLYFLTQQTQAWKDKYVKSLVALAGPWGGAVKSLEVFAVGTDMNEWIFKDIPIAGDLVKEVTRFVERTQPSLAWLMPSSDIWSDDILVKTESNSEDYTASNLGEYFKLLDVPNMAMMYDDTQPLLAGLPDPGVEVRHGHR